MTPWTVACQAPVPWNFPGKITTVAYCFLLTENLSYPGIKLASPALAGGFFTTEPFMSFYEITGVLKEVNF